MKYFAIIAITLLFAGCSTADETSPASPRPASPAPRAASMEDLFIEVVRDQPASRGVSDADLIGLAYATCELYSAAPDGETAAMAVVLAALDADFDPALAGAITGAGVVAFCPENEWMLP